MSESGGGGPLTPSHQKDPGPRAMVAPSEAAEDESVRFKQQSGAVSHILRQPVPLQRQRRRLNHLNPPQRDPWRVTHHSNARTSAEALIWQKRPLG